MDPTKPAESDPDALRPLSGSEESLLVRLVDEFTAASRRGETPDIETLARQHPELADELRSLWATIWMAEVLGRDQEAEGEPGDRSTLAYPTPTPIDRRSLQTPIAQSRLSPGPVVSAPGLPSPETAVAVRWLSSFSKSLARGEWGLSSGPGS